MQDCKVNVARPDRVPAEVRGDALLSSQQSWPGHKPVINMQCHNHFWA